MAKVHCPHPEHEDSTPSLEIYQNGAYCFGCHRRFSLEWLAEMGIDTSQAAQSNGKGNGSRGPTLAEIRWFSHALTMGPLRDRVEWFYSRGFSHRTIERFLFGHNGESFVIPLWYDGEIKGVQYRRDDERAEEVAGPKYRTPRGQPIQAIRPEPGASRPFVVCEGPLDTYLLVQYGFDAFSTAGGAGSLPRALRRELRGGRGHRVVVATDADAAGRDAYTSIRKVAPASRRVVWPAGKDITEALMLVDPLDRGNMLNKWISEAEAWEETANTLGTRSMALGM